MNHIFHDLINEGYITIYMDDILIHTPDNPALHCRVVNDVLCILAENDLYLKPQKCVLEVPEVEYLGVIIREDSIAMDPVKVQGVKNWKRPTTLKEVRAFLGFLNFYRMYIHGVRTGLGLLANLAILYFGSAQSLLLGHCVWPVDEYRGC
jgi:hypothetical protein